MLFKISKVVITLRFSIYNFYIEFFTIFSAEQFCCVHFHIMRNAYDISFCICFSCYRYQQYFISVFGVFLSGSDFAEYIAY